VQIVPGQVNATPGLLGCQLRIGFRVTTADHQPHVAPLHAFQHPVEQPVETGRPHVGLAQQQQP